MQIETQAKQHIRIWKEGVREREREQSAVPHLEDGQVGQVQTRFGSGTGSPSEVVRDLVAVPRGHWSWREGTAATKAECTFQILVTAT